MGSDTSLGTTREFDDAGALVSVDGDDQVKKPAHDGDPKATERIFNDAGELVAGVGDPIPENAEQETPAEVVADAPPADPPPADPDVISEATVLSEPAPSDAPPAS